MTMLFIVNNAQQRLGLDVSTTVAGNADDTTTQLLALLNQAGEEYAEVYTWQALTKEATFTTLAAESQGAIETIAPGIDHIINGTIWNRTLNRPVVGSLSATDWQRMKSSSVSGPVSEFRIRGGLLMFIPAPVAGNTCAFEYKTQQWATDTAGAGKRRFTVDTDVSLLDEYMLILSLIWRFKQAQGLDFATELQMYENRLTNKMARDGGKPTLHMDGSSGSFSSGIVIPEGNWTP